MRINKCEQLESQKQRDNLKFYGFPEKSVENRTYKSTMKKSKSNVHTGYLVKTRHNVFRTNIYISEDFPSRVSKARYNLRPFLKRELQSNNCAYIRYDKLVVNGETFKLDSESKDLIVYDSK